MNKRNIALDIFKLFLSYLVICIHCPSIIPLKIINPLARISVPCFFIISGFLTKIDKNTNFINYIKKSFFYLIFGILVYFFYDLFMAIKNSQNIECFFLNYFFYENIFRDFFFLNLTKGSGFHLWFLIALFVIKIVHYIIMKLKLDKNYIFISIILLTLNIMLSIFPTLLKISESSLVFTRNFLFLGLPFFIIGHKFKTIELKKTIIKNIFLVLGIIFFLLQYFEFNFYNTYLINFTFKDLCISSILSSIFLCLYFTNLKSKKIPYKYISPNLSFNIYTYHILIYIITEKIIIKYNYQIWLKKAELIFIYAILLCELFYLIKLKIKKNTNSQSKKNL